MEFNAAFVFFKSFSAKQGKKGKEKRNDYSVIEQNALKPQLYGKYFKRFASKNDRSKWPARWEFDRSSPRSGRTLSVDRPLFWALWKRLNIHYHTIFSFISAVRLMWRSTFVPGKRFWSLRFIRLMQTDRTCSDELNWARRRPFHEFNSLGLVRLMKSSTFGLVLSVLTEMLSDQETLWQEYGCNVYSIGFNLGLFIYNQGNCFSSCWRDKTERKLGNIVTWCLR